MDMHKEETKDPEQFESLLMKPWLEGEKEREIQLERGKEWGMQAPSHHIKYTNACVYLQHEDKQILITLKFYKYSSYYT